MRRAVLAAAGVIATLVLQLTVVNRLPWPGGASPDLVLLMVVALGLYGSPMSGAVTGFLAGLGLDIAPPGSYLIGTYALVFCLVGYGCGRLRGLLGTSIWRLTGAAVLAAAAGEALVSAVGRLIGDPQVTWSAIRGVLPVAMAYDAALAPFVLYFVMRVLTWAAALGPVNQLAGAQLARSRSPAQARATAGRPGGAWVLGGAGLLGGTGWLAGPLGGWGARGSSSSRVPRLREAAARTGDGWIGSSPATRRTASGRRGPGRTPRLRPGSGPAGSAAAIQRRPPLPRRPVNLRLGRARRRGGAIGPGNGSAGLAYQRRDSGPAGSVFRGSSGPRGSAYRGGSSGPRGSAFRGASSGPRGSAYRGGSSGPRGPAFRGASSGPVGPAFRGGAAHQPRGSAFRSGGSGHAGPSLRGAGHGPPAKAFRGGSRSGAFSRGRPGGGRSPLAGSGARARAPRFRPDGRLSGGSAFGSPKRRTPAARPVTLRLRSPRRRVGVLSSGLVRGARRRPAGAGPVRLRLGGTRRGDGMVAGLAPPGRRFGRRARLAAPRFRGHSASSAALARRRGLGSGKQAKFRTGRRSLLSAWTRGRLGARSGARRIGSTRIGGPS
jgi:rod shape-determining protein MreD